MGSVAAVKQTILVIGEELGELIETHSWGLRDLLVTYKIPREKWNDIWLELENEGVFSEMDEDLDVQWIVGWFQGIAAALGSGEKQLVEL